MVSVALLDLPTRDRVECRSPQRLSCAQAEAGVVPWAADGIRDEYTLSKRTVVMGTLRPDREQLPTAARNQHCFAAGLSQDHAALGEICYRDPLAEVGSGEFRMLFAHDCLLLTAKSPL